MYFKTPGTLIFTYLIFSNSNNANAAPVDSASSTVSATVSRSTLNSESTRISNQEFVNALQAVQRDALDTNDSALSDLLDDLIPRYETAKNVIANNTATLERRSDSDEDEAATSQIQDKSLLSKILAFFNGGRSFPSGKTAITTADTSSSSDSVSSIHKSYFTISLLHTHTSSGKYRYATVTSDSLNLIRPSDAGVGPVVGSDVQRYLSATRAYSSKASALVTAA